MTKKIKSWISIGFSNKVICPYCNRTVGKLTCFGDNEFDFIYCPFCGKRVAALKGENDNAS